MKIPFQALRPSSHLRLNSPPWTLLKTRRYQASGDGWCILGLLFSRTIILNHFLKKNFNFYSHFPQLAPSAQTSAFPIFTWKPFNDLGMWNCCTLQWNICGGGLRWSDSYARGKDVHAGWRHIMHPLHSSRLWCAMKKKLLVISLLAHFSAVRLLHLNNQFGNSLYIYIYNFF